MKIAKHSAKKDACGSQKKKKQSKEKKPNNNNNGCIKIQMNKLVPPYGSLCNAAPFPFELAGHTWATVVKYYTT